MSVLRGTNPAFATHATKSAAFTEQGRWGKVWLRSRCKKASLSKARYAGLSARCSRKTSSRTSRSIRSTLNPATSDAQNRRSPGSGHGRNCGVSPSRDGISGVGRPYLTVPEVHSTVCARSRNDQTPGEQCLTVARLLAADLGALERSEESPWKSRKEHLRTSSFWTSRAN